MSRYVAVILCCVHGMRDVIDIPDVHDSLNDASLAAEDDICHRGDTAIVADRVERRAGIVEGPSLTPVQVRDALRIADRRAVQNLDAA